MQSIENNPQVVLDSAVAHISKTSLLDLCLQAELLVQLVMILLLLSSIWGWTIIFSKMIILNSFKRKIKTFLSFFQTSKSINQLYKYSTEKRHKHTLAQVLLAAVDEWQIQPKGSESISSSALSANVKERVNHSMTLAINKSINKLESNIGFLATISSSSPFIGLFGTVWGIMSSFQSIAATKNTTLAVVAPGIAEALLATAFGLIAAIPAVIFYNKFSAEIDQISKDAEDFKMELNNLMLRELV
jgi:biopolymer transport protein TolQ